MLRSVEANAPPQTLAPIEALLPSSALRAVLERLVSPAPAHVALAFLHTVAPLEDRRLLVALEHLVFSGCVSVLPAVAFPVATAAG